MRNYLTRLLEHMSYEGPLLDIPSRPISFELVERLVEYFSSPRSEPKADADTVGKDRLPKIRTGLVVDHVIDGVLHTLLGRKCRSVLEIGPDARLKTAGGYAQFDPSMIEALSRELGEEGFYGEYRISPKTISPLCSLSAKPEGKLHFYSGRPDNYPDLPSGGLGVFRECDDGDKIFAGYFTLEELVKTTYKPNNSNIHGETIVAAANSYFWNKSREIDMCDRHTLATPRGKLQIPLDVRNSIFARMGMSPYKKSPRFGKCAVYFAIPVQAKYLFAVRMFLSTDIFLHHEEFSPEDAPLKEFMDRHPNHQGIMWGSPASS
ncbi:hypothetical protein HZB90_03355 [archaeon]|nr:hypothetical protein [archaeon]